MSAIGTALKPKPYHGTQMTVGLRPGDPLPAGRYINSWKLDPSAYGKSTMFLIYEPDDKSVLRPAKKEKV